MGSITLPSILTPDFGLFFWMFVAFMFVFLILAKFGFPVITKSVEERNNFIEESLRKAHEAQERISNIEKEGEAILQEAREKQAQLLKEATETRDAIVGKAQDKAREEAARILSEARVGIEAEKQNAIRDIRSQVAQLSVQVAEQVLRKDLSSDANQMSLIDRLLDDISVDQKVN